jgi:hypothetical protein
MELTICRVDECNKKSSIHFFIYTQELTKNEIYLCVPAMWEHYMVHHKFQAQKYQRNLIMGVKLNDPTLTCEKIIARSAKQPAEVRVLCIEKTTDGFDHAIGGVDYSFINHLKGIIAISESKKGQKVIDPKIGTRRERVYCR